MAERAVVAIILAAMLRLVNSRLTRFAIPVTRIVVRAVVNMRLSIPSAVQALEHVILKKPVLGRMLLVLLMLLLLMVTTPISLLSLFVVCTPLTLLPGTSCGDSSLYCASGQCTSRDLQCKTLMGSLTQGNDTNACSDDGCQISCSSPSFGSNVCYSMQQNFLDGTSCGGGGRCKNGSCKGTSVGGEIKEWVSHNKTLVISLSTVLGSLALIGILSCLLSCWRRKRLAPASAGGINSKGGKTSGRNDMAAAAVASSNRKSRRRPDGSKSTSGSSGSGSGSSGRRHRSRKRGPPTDGPQIPSQMYPQMGQIRAGPDDYYPQPPPYTNRPTVRYA